MPTLIPADKWEFASNKLGPNFSQNNVFLPGITTEKLLESVEEIINRPEIHELDRLLESPLYLRGKSKS